MVFKSRLHSYYFDAVDGKDANPLKSVADKIMNRRANRLCRRLAPHLAACGRVADIGSGTGHNAKAIRESESITVDEFDVADLHWIGAGPVLFDGLRIPAIDRTYDAALLIFVLQYPQSSCLLLTEANRITRGTIIVIQSTYGNRVGRVILRLRSWIWETLAYRCARLFVRRQTRSVQIGRIRMTSFSHCSSRLD